MSAWHDICLEEVRAGSPCVTFVEHTQAAAAKQSRCAGVQTKPVPPMIIWAGIFVHRADVDLRSAAVNFLAAADFTHAGQGRQPLSQDGGGRDPSRQARGRSSAV